MNNPLCSLRSARLVVSQQNSIAAPPPAILILLILNDLSKFDSF